MAAPVEIKVPDIGNFSDVPVVDVLVKEGDTVEVETPLITLETEKATMDVPSSAAGRVTALKVKKGSKVSQGSVVLVLEPTEGSVAKAPAAAPAPGPAYTETTVRQPAWVRGDSEPTVRQPSLSQQVGAHAPAAAATAAPAAAKAQVAPAPQSALPGESRTAEVINVDFSAAHASPSVRKFARELGVDLTRVQGSGDKGRITHEDVKAWVKKALTQEAPGAASALPKLPVVDFSRFGPVEVRPLGRIQKISAQRLQASWVNIPHVTQFDLADFTDVEQARGQLKTKAIQEGIKLTPLAFVIKACVRAIQEFPLFASSLDVTGENLVLKKYMHIGFAADTPNGLVVPVIRNADHKDIYELARDLGTLSARARDGKLTAAEMQGGCFTVSSLGSIGGTAFTPIINPPEVAILGVSRAVQQPVYRDGAFVPRLMLPLSLSYDHRVIDGALAVRFTSFVVRVLGDVRALVEAIP
jgi:pyruvate dehydrogenase E2 component (dihydrolipoamide acetyltransferase)